MLEDLAEVENVVQKEGTGHHIPMGRNEKSGVPPEVIHSSEKLTMEWSVPFVILTDRSVKCDYMVSTPRLLLSLPCFDWFLG